MILGVGTTYAQDTTLKPVAKSVTAEMNFDPFSGSALSINYLRFRSFRTETMATRLGISTSFRSEKPDEEITQNYFEINLRPGYEKHFAGTERLSPFIGMELDLAVKVTKWKNTDPVATGSQYKEITGAWQGGSQRGFVRAGANFIMGTDFYFAKHFYVGTEFGLGIQYVKAADVKFKRETGQNPDDEKGGSSIQFGPNFNSSIRLGFMFK